MKRITFIRHAKSSWDQPNLKDFDRPLNDRGTYDAPLMAKEFRKRDIPFDLIISSPSKRTMQTLELMCPYIDYDLEDILWERAFYHASPKTMLMMIQPLPEVVEHVCIVGHNPGITEIVNMLQRDNLIENVPTCGIVSLIYKGKTWNDLRSETCSLDGYIYPKMFK